MFNGPGCITEERHLTMGECEHAIAFLGYNRKIEYGSWTWAPKGCLVSMEEGDNNRFDHSFFNKHKYGSSTVTKYRSICLNGGKYFLCSVK